MTTLAHEAREKAQWMSNHRSTVFGYASRENPDQGRMYVGYWDALNEMERKFNEMADQLEELSMRAYTTLDDALNILMSARQEFEIENQKIRNADRQPDGDYVLGRADMFQKGIWQIDFIIKDLKGQMAGKRSS